MEGLCYLSPKNIVVDFALACDVILISGMLSPIGVKCLEPPC